MGNFQSDGFMHNSEDNDRVAQYSNKMKSKDDLGTDIIIPSSTLFLTTVCRFIVSISSDQPHWT